jgi:hypothetical protein
VFVPAAVSVGHLDAARQTTATEAVYEQWRVVLVVVNLGDDGAQVAHERRRR